jgi:glycosyltransferase involved in cell wall biosynthesis
MTDIGVMTPLRITIVQGAFLPVPPLLGGAVEKVWFALGREFARKGHHVVHVSRSYPGLANDAVDEGVRYRRVQGHATPRALWRLKLLDLLYSLRVQRVLPPADILVTNTFWLPLLERRASRGRPYVHVARYPKGQMKLYPQRAVLQTVSEPIRSAILAEATGAEERVRVVPYPLSPVYLQPKPAQKRPVILYTGRIHPEKGLHLLVEAFLALDSAASKGWTLRLVGPWQTSQGGGGAAYRDQILAVAKQASGRIELLEPVFDEAELVRHYREAAVFAYPSVAEYGETFGLSVLEAMASGCVPVVSALGCFADFVRDGGNGVVFDHRAAKPADKLARALTSVTASSDDRARMSDQAWTTARNYTLPNIADQFIADFSGLIAPHSAPTPSLHACLPR